MFSIESRKPGHQSKITYFIYTSFNLGNFGSCLSLERQVTLGLWLARVLIRAFSLFCYQFKPSSTSISASTSTSIINNQPSTSTSKSNFSYQPTTTSSKRGEEQGSKSPFSLLSEPISPSSLLSEPISPFSLNVYLAYSPSSLHFHPISPSSQLFLGHFSLLPILFLPPLVRLVIGHLRSYDGNCNENVTLKLNFALSVLRLFHVDHFVQNRRTALSLAW